MLRIGERDFVELISFVAVREIDGAPETVEAVPRDFNSVEESV